MVESTSINRVSSNAWEIGDREKRLTGSLDQFSFDTFLTRNQKHGKTVSSVDTDREVIREVTAASEGEDKRS